MDYSSIPPPPPPLPGPSPERRRGVPIGGLVAAGLLAAVLAIGVSALSGYRAGQREREIRATQTASAEAEVQFGLGLEDLAADRFALAAERFRFVLAADPNYPGAAERLAEAEAALGTPKASAAPLDRLSQAGIGIGRLAYPAFDAQRGLFALHVLDAGGDPIHLAPGGSQPTWRADGDALTYRGTSGAEGLYLQVGDEPAALLIPGAAFYPSFSPNGSLIAYEARDMGQIVIVRSDCQQTAEGCRPQALTPGRAPLWGPGGLIAYNACTDEGCGLFVIDPAVGGPPRRLTGHADDLPGAWSPDGACIAFMSDSGGDWEVFVISLSGEFTRLTDSPHSDGLPAWSPDGRMIAFVSDRDGRWGLYLMDLDGGGPPRRIVDLDLRPPYWPDERVSWGP